MTVTCVRCNCNIPEDDKYVRMNAKGLLCAKCAGDCLVSGESKAVSVIKKPVEQDKHK